MEVNKLNQPSPRPLFYDIQDGIIAVGKGEGVVWMGRVGGFVG